MLYGPEFSAGTLTRLHDAIVDAEDVLLDAPELLDRHMEQVRPEVSEAVVDAQLALE